MVDRTIPSAAVRKILLQYTDPAKKKVLTAAVAVLKEHPKATPQQQAAKIIEISSRTLPKPSQTKKFKNLMRAAYKALAALKALKDATGLPKSFSLARSFGVFVLSAAHTLEITKAELPTSDPAKGEDWLTSKTPLADVEITPYDLSTGTEE